MNGRPLADPGSGSSLARATVAVAIVMCLIPSLFCFAQGVSNSNAERNFSLRQGHGTPVCEAYLELLNRTKFEVTPFCGRPEEGAVKGFEHLEGHYMKLEEVWPLFTEVWEFMRFGDQHHVEKFFYPSSISPKLSHWSTDATTRDIIAQNLSYGWMSVWVYASPVDVNNDGSALKVITWQGYGATGTGARCGDDYATHPWTDSYISTRAFVLTDDGKALDENKTRLIFGAPAGAVRGVDPQLPSGSAPAGPLAFKPLADSVGIFEYEGRYYIETEDRPKSKDAGLPPINVFVRENGNTKQMCRFYPESVPVPQD